MYKIVFTQGALRDWETIGEQVQIRIAEKLREYAKEPLKYARKLVTPKIGTYRFRIGAYRVIFDIGNENIVVLRIGHRRNIYR